MTEWMRCASNDAALLKLADRHYSRRKPGSASFVPSARSIVLKTPDGQCGWVSVWFSDRQVTSPWTGETWVCSFFRNESNRRASDLIKEAIGVTRYLWGEPPDKGMTTFVEAEAVASEVSGYVFRRAKFRHIGETGRGLMVFRVTPAKMPPAMAPFGETPMWVGDPFYVQPSERITSGGAS